MLYHNMRPFLSRELAKFHAMSYCMKQGSNEGKGTYTLQPVKTMKHFRNTSFPN